MKYKLSNTINRIVVNTYNKKQNKTFLRFLKKYLLNLQN